MKSFRIASIALIYLALHLIIGLTASKIVPPEIFPYQDDLVKSGLPKIIYSLANFDGAQYLKIAQHGYLPLTQAFFPLYPVLIGALYLLIPSYLISGLIISFISFVGIIYLFITYLRSLSIANKNIRWALMYLLIFPTSFFFISVYTESLFFFFFLGSLVGIRKKNYPLACFCAFAIGFTRVTGILMIIPLFMELLAQHQRSSSRLIHSLLLTLKTKKILILFMPIIGCIVYGIYLNQTTGDFFAFFHLQPISNATRSTNFVLLPQVLYRYLRIFITAAPNVQYFIAAVEFATLLFVGGFICYDFWKMHKGSQNNRYSRIGLNLFSLMALILPTTTGTLSSLPRYALPLLSTYLILAHITNYWIKIAISLIFIVLHAVLFSLFMQGYFVS